MLSYSHQHILPANRGYHTLQPRKTSLKLQNAEISCRWSSAPPAHCWALSPPAPMTSCSHGLSGHIAVIYHTLHSQKQSIKLQKAEHSCRWSSAPAAHCPALSHPAPITSCSEGQHTLGSFGHWGILPANRGYRTLQPQKKSTKWQHQMAI